MLDELRIDFIMLIQELFFKTIQGEGYWTGMPCDFIRIYGCPVGCPWCDTGYADGGQNIHRVNMSIPEITEKIISRNVVITGGEPFTNAELPSLINNLVDNHKEVHVETSGIRWQEVDNPLIDKVWITLSPKEHVSRLKVDDRFWGRASETKIVIKSIGDFEYYLPRIDKSKPVFVQPCDDGELLQESVKPCLDVASKYPWVRLSLQTHKIIGVQ